MKKNLGSLAPAKAMFKKVKLSGITANRSKLIAWYVADCNSLESHREDFASFIANYIPVDIFGPCGNLVCQTSGIFRSNLCREEKMEIFLSNRKFKPRFLEDIFSQKNSIEISSSSEFLAVGLFLFLDPMCVISAQWDYEMLR